MFSCAFAPTPLNTSTVVPAGTLASWNCPAPLTVVVIVVPCTVTVIPAPAPCVVSNSDAIGPPPTVPWMTAVVAVGDAPPAGEGDVGEAAPPQAATAKAAMITVIKRFMPVLQSKRHTPDGPPN